ncbi:hypothetical protein GCM10009525_81410 [Streptosporangium amethystogenes subsp. fukuiense]
MVRSASKSPSSTWPPVLTVTSSSAPLEALTTTFLFGRTVLLPWAGLIFISGAAGVLGASVPGPATGAFVSAPVEQAVASTAAVARARAASGVLWRSTVSTISLPHYSKLPLKH